MDTSLAKNREDEKYMRQAISIAERGHVTAPPNPWVGCVIVKNGQIVGKGYHIQPGSPHAEVNALNEALENARDSELYVTLEPCSHYGKTPPCVEAILKANPSRVIISHLDPDEKVNGQGIRRLKEAGIDVTVGVLQEETAFSLRSYLHHRKKQKPYVIGKCALSLDGKIAAEDGSSKWISSEKARVDAHHLRSHSQAILVGVGTAFKDNPQLTVRLPGIEVSPLKIVFDPKGKFIPKGHLVESGKLLVVTEEGVSRDWNIPNIEVVQFPKNELIKALLEFLGKRGILQLLVEGGGVTLGRFLEEKCLDELHLYYAPIILGDKGIPSFKGVSISSLSESPKLQIVHTERFDETLKLLLIFN